LGIFDEDFTQFVMGFMNAWGIDEDNLRRISGKNAL
jgi:hypothetical protein